MILLRIRTWKMFVMALLLAVLAVFPAAGEDAKEDAAASVATTAESGDGVLADWSTTEYASKTGFSFQVISDEEQGFVWGKTQNGIGAQRVDPETYNTLYEEFVIHGVTDFKENPEDANAFYDRYDYQDGEAVLKQEEIEIDGHPARIVLRVSLQGGLVTYIGSLYYARNNTVLKVRLLSIPPQGAVTEPPKVTVSDMARIAEGIHYDETEAELKQADGAFQILCTEGVSEILAGGSLHFETRFASQKVREKSSLTNVVWRVTEAETGAFPEGVSISDKGYLTTKKKIDRVMNLVVTAESGVFHLTSEYPVTVIPAVSGVTVTPSRLTMYMTAGASATVQARMIPESVPPVGLTWTASPRKTVEIIPGDDGMVTIRPLSSGKATVTVQGLGGKKATVQVKIVDPVTDIALSIGGTPRAGGKVRVIWNLLPKSAGVKDVDLSLDVDSSIATISKSGMVTIQPGVPSGTIITVTCNAYGAPEPVSRYITFIVK